MKVHDARKLQVCSECGQLGIHSAELATDTDVPLVVQTSTRQWAHPRCLTIDELLALPAVELREVRLGDVEPATIRRLLKKL